MDRANGVEEFFLQGVLEQLALSAGFQRTDNLHIACIGLQNDPGLSTESCSPRSDSDLVFPRALGMRREP
jgi:hypothetical protein